MREQAAELFALDRGRRAPSMSAAMRCAWRATSMPRFAHILAKRGGIDLGAAKSRLAELARAGRLHASPSRRGGRTPNVSERRVGRFLPTPQLPRGRCALPSGEDSQYSRVIAAGPGELGEPRLRRAQIDCRPVCEDVGERGIDVARHAHRIAADIDRARRPRSTRTAQPPAPRMAMLDIDLFRLVARESHVQSREQAVRAEPFRAPRGRGNRSVRAGRRRTASSSPWRRSRADPPETPGTARCRCPGRS